MSQVITYKSATLLRDLLSQHFGVKFKKETFSMRTSGIYIPLWDPTIPHVWDGTTAQWCFYYRFANHFPDLNVSEAFDVLNTEGAHKLALRINSHRQK